MAVLWIGLSALAFLALDLWNHHRQKKVKHKKVNLGFMLIEASVAMGAFGWWLISR